MTENIKTCHLFFLHPSETEFLDLQGELSAEVPFPVVGSETTGSSGTAVSRRRSRSRGWNFEGCQRKLFWWRRFASRTLPCGFYRPRLEGKHGPAGLRGGGTPRHRRRRFAQAAGRRCTAPIVSFLLYQVLVSHGLSAVNMTPPLPSPLVERSSLWHG